MAITEPQKKNTQNTAEQIRTCINHNNDIWTTQTLHNNF